eukprot:CAMPEP_0117464440 /NCGR_PEP_ID=MMETSP0784-20121206/4103_1 /TAXON_ID=39447 /ORGANISM="" /LENGTH=125 /DNA_ID=CAMNT_0005258301 /DNA_START=36 /DNA_END=413 /DNA_ORIENTATION=-
MAWSQAPVARYDEDEEEEESKKQEPMLRARSSNHYSRREIRKEVTLGAAFVEMWPVLRPIVVGLACVMAAILGWLVQLEGHLTEFAWIFGTMLAWGLAFWHFSSRGKASIAPARQIDVGKRQRRR